MPGPGRKWRPVLTPHRIAEQGDHTPREWTRALLWRPGLEALIPGALFSAAMRLASSRPCARPGRPRGNARGAPPEPGVPLRCRPPVVDDVAADPGADEQHHCGEADHDPSRRARRRRPFPPARPGGPGEEQERSRLDAQGQYMSRRTSSIWTGTLRKASRPANAVSRPVAT